MPLLREHRRASRTRNTAVLSGSAAVVVALIVVSFFTRRGEPDPSIEVLEEARASIDPSEVGAGAPIEALPALPADEPSYGAVDGEPESGTPESPAAVVRTTTRFGDARSFRQALQNAGIEGEDRTELEKALESVMDFRRCRPEDRMILERDAEGRVVLFEYHASITSYVRSTRDTQGRLTAERVEVPVQRKRLDRGGRVVSSLGEAFERVGLGRTLVGSFLEAFDGKIDFASDTREGDCFRVMVDEERIHGSFLRYGTVHALEYVGQRTGAVRAYWYAPRPGEGEFHDETGRAVRGGWLRTPLHYDRISSRFDPKRRHPILKRVVPHNGVDYAAPTGTPVWAAAAGTITYAGYKGANGNLVTIRHDGGYETVYCHLHRISKGMKPGVKVNQRQVIGAVGTTGRSTGPHLHFGLKRGGRYVDPLGVINGPGRPLPASALPRFRQHAQSMRAALSRIECPRPSGAVASARPAASGAEAPMD